MSDELDNIPNIANIHKIRSKNFRPSTATYNKTNSNKQLINKLKKKNLDFEKIKILDVKIILIYLFLLKYKKILLHHYLIKYFL
jgi:hypothetical protein